jgi:hypothetical protein
MLGCEFRDISEYKIAFSESQQQKPQSKPEQRPWLEAHLEAQGGKSFYPNSEPVQSLFHWVEPKSTWITKGEFPPVSQAPQGRISQDGPPSAYLTEFRHSLSLDFGDLEAIEA